MTKPLAIEDVEQMAADLEERRASLAECVQAQLRQRKADIPRLEGILLALSCGVPEDLRVTKREAPIVTVPHRSEHGDGL